jgi:transposase-like protein
MRALDAGSTTGEIARKYQTSPHLLDRWLGEWRALAQSLTTRINNSSA